MKKLLFLAALFCTVFANFANAQAYLSDGAVIQIGDTYMEENFLRAGDVPELKQGTMTYDPTNHVLTLTDVVIEAATSADYGLILGCPNMPKGSKQMEIRVVGTNYIKHSRSSGYTMLLGDGSYTITGLNGTLYVMSNAGIGMLLGCNDLTVKDGVCVFAGYSESGMQTRVGVMPFFADPLLAIDCATFKAFGTEYCMSYLNPSLNDAEVEGGYVYDESVFTWKDGSDVLKNKTLTFNPTKTVFWWINDNPEGGTVSVTKGGNPLPNPYRYGADETEKWIDVVATPNEGWEFDDWRTFNGALKTSQPATQYGLPEVHLAKSAMLISFFHHTEPAAPSKPWYVLSNYYDQISELSGLAASPKTVASSVPDKTEVTQATFAEGRLYYLDQTTSTEVAFVSTVFDPATGNLTDRKNVFASQDKYQRFQTLTYSIADNCFYATAKKNNEKQYLLKISMTGVITEIAEITNTNMNEGVGVYLMAADRKGGLYGIFRSGENYDNEKSPFRHGSMLCKISKETAAITPIGWTGFYFENPSNSMAFDYKTDALVGSACCNNMSCLVSIDVKTGRGTRLQDWGTYCNGIFQMIPETHTVAVGVKSGDEDKGSAVIKETGKTSGRYMVGDKFEIEASPKTKEYRFVQWSDGNKDNPRTVTMDEAVTTYTAEFDWAEDMTLYPVIAGGVQMNSYKTVLNSGNCPHISTGFIRFDPQTGTLTLNNLSLDDASSEYALEIGDKENRMEINMVLEGDNHINAYNTAVVRLNNLKMNISGNALTVNTGYTATGIYLAKTDLTLYAVKKVEINANGFGFYSNEHSTLTFLGTNCDLTGLGGAIEGGWDAVELKHCSIKSPADAKFNEEKGRLEDSNGDAIKSKVVIATDPEVRGTAMQEGTGEVVISSGDTEFSSVGWFDVGTEITITAKPADGYVFSHWMDDDNWTDEEKRKPAVRTFKTTGTENPFTALFYYQPKSTATWYAVYDENFVSFTMGDHAEHPAVASAPAATGIVAGDWRKGAWEYRNSMGVTSLPFSGLEDNKELSGSGSEEQLISNSLLPVTDMAYDISNGVMYAVGSQKLLRLNYGEKKIEEVGAFWSESYANLDIVAIAVALDGTIYAIDFDPVEGTLYKVVEIDSENKKVKLESVTGDESGNLGAPVSSSPHSLAFDLATGELFWGSDKYLRVIDTQTAKSCICGDFGMKNGMQDELRAMHCMNRFVNVTVKVAEGCEDMGTVSKSKSKVIAGSKVTITAKANSGYRFRYWKRGDSEINSESYTLSPKVDVTYTAYFEKTAGLDEVSADAADGARKLLIDGALYILRDGHLYTPAGQMVR